MTTKIPASMVEADVATQAELDAEATTFKVRIGGTSAGATTFNGSGGGRKLGGVMASSITITEIKV